MSELETLAQKIRDQAAVAVPAPTLSLVFDANSYLSWRVECSLLPADTAPVAVSAEWPDEAAGKALDILKSVIPSR